MNQLIIVEENGLNIVIEINEERDVRLLHFSAAPFDGATIGDEQRKGKFRLVELHISGENQCEHHGTKHNASMPGNRLKYKEHRDYRNAAGRKLEIDMEDDGLVVTSNFQFFDNVPVVRSWTDVVNTGSECRGIEYISSFALTGIAKEGLQHWYKKSRLYAPHNTWYGEAQWRKNSLPELGLSPVFDFSVKALQYSSTGTWSACKYLPMGCFENIQCGTLLFWQIEHNGSWHWELGDTAGHLYLLLSGPTENESHWWKNLKPGEAFSSVPVAVGAAYGGFEKAIGELTRYRRLIRRPNSDNENLPVIFNDFMNCLFGEPTTEKLIPLIDAASKAGCEYFCIDCGWYSDGEWWDGVGQWLPSKKRFPGGLKEVLEYIRSKGMIPGLWLELEVMGIKCPTASEVPDDWFFMRHGRRVIDNRRYQLDFRNPDVRKFADEVIDRLVKDYGAGYIKMDYNIDAGPGTELDSDSFGDGLLMHNRAYLKWLDGIFERYPDLVIENCGSGGMRMDYALLSRHSIQSSSDQTDYRKYAAITASCPTAVTPEQCAVWSYPLRDGDCEEVIFNMVNAMLMRVHQSGHLAEISPERFELVREGISCYKSIRGDLKKGLPFWPLKLPGFTDQWISLGLKCGGNVYLAAWRMGGSEGDCSLPVNLLKGMDISAKCIYPSNENCNYQWNKENGQLSVFLPNQYSARLFKLCPK